VLPQLRGDLFLTDGGIETTLIFHRGLDLPEFAAFPLLEDAEGLEVLRAYYEPYLRLAGEHGSGFVLESPTWRASPRWGQALGYDAARLDELNRRAIGLMEVLRAEHAPVGGDIVISGCIGPHDDGYDPAVTLSAQEAQAYHATQIGTFADAGADLVTAMTITYAEEAIGMTRAAGDSGLPAAVSYRRDRRPAAERPDAGGRHRPGRPRGGPPARLLHGQLRAPHPLRGRARAGRAVASADPRPARERVDQEPRRAR
jgi:S-methylmethionine-dependent homocysteine/selenocysteine methylase